MPDARKKPCRICLRWFYPDPRVGDRQRACANAACQATRRQKTQAGWRRQNPGYGAAYRIDQRRRQSEPEPLRVPAPLNKLPWDLAKDEFGGKGADFIGVACTLLLRAAKDQSHGYPIDPTELRRAVEQKIPVGVVLVDAGYGNGTPFRTAVSELGLQYVAGIESSTTVWGPGRQPLPAPPRKRGRGATPKRLRRDAHHQPTSVKELARHLPAAAWKDIGWRQGSQGMLRSRFAAVRVRAAHRDEKRTEPHPEEWLLIEWPKGESEPTKYWLSTLPEKSSLRSLVKMAKHRWIIERDYEELKQELGLGPSALARS